MKKVCIIHETGNGRLGGHFIENAFLGLPGVEIAAIADSNKDRTVADYIPRPAQRYYDYKEMVVKEKPDILVLASRLPEEHFEQIDFAMEHHCHVLTEKPFVADLIQADYLISKAAEQNIQIAVAHLGRFSPIFQTMKKMITAGDIGQILSCNLRGKEDNRGGGEDMMVLGSHLLDMAVYLFDHPLEVYSDIRINGRTITSRDIIPTDEPIGLTAGDDVTTFYRFPGNIKTIFESRRGMVKRDVATRLGIVVTGTQASIAVRFENNRSLRICRNFPTPNEDESRFEEVFVATPPEIPGAAPIDYKQCVLNPANAGHRYYADNNRRIAWDLLQSIERNRPLLSSATDAIWSLEMIIGAYRSAVERHPLTFPLIERKHPLCK